MGTLLDDFENVSRKLQPFLEGVAARINVGTAAKEILKMLFALPYEAQFVLVMKYVKTHEKVLGSKDKDEADILLARFLPAHYKLLKPEEIEKGWKYAEVLLLILAQYETEK